MVYGLYVLIEKKNQSRFSYTKSPLMSEFTKGVGAESPTSGPKFFYDKNGLWFVCVYREKISQDFYIQNLLCCLNLQKK